MENEQRFCCNDHEEIVKGGHISVVQLELKYRAIIGKIIVEVSRTDGELAQRLIDEYL